MIQVISDPLWISTTTNNAPDSDLVLTQRVVNRMREHAAQKPIVVTINTSVYPCCYAEFLNLSSKSGGKVVTNSSLLIFIEPLSFVEISHRLVRDENLHHRLPIVRLT